MPASVSWIKEQFYKTENYLLFLFKFLVPELVSANTNAAAVMIGERGADFIKEDYLDGTKIELWEIII